MSVDIRAGRRAEMAESFAYTCAAVGPSTPWAQHAMGTAASARRARSTGVTACSLHTHTHTHTPGLRALNKMYEYMSGQNKERTNV